MTTNINKDDIRPVNIITIIIIIIITNNNNNIAMALPLSHNYLAASTCMLRYVAEVLLSMV